MLLNDDPNYHFAVALSDICSPYQAFKPPRRITVAEGAADILMIKQPGGYSGPWSPAETPYMIEPMNMMASRSHEAVCFVGPARTGKTMALLDGFMAHCVVNDPGDMLIVQMSQDKAREFSKTRVDRAIRNSPKLKDMMSHSAQDDNTHDKQFRHGMWLRIGWPTVPNLSSSDYRYALLTDYDRHPEDIGGEGSGFMMALKRTQTYLSRGMCGVESSPGYALKDPNWEPATAHEAPPTGGILSIYNQGDRRRWYWPCPDCREWFEASPGLKLFALPSDDELIEMVRDMDIDEFAGRYNRIVCPHCGSIIPPKMKSELNSRGRWLRDGQTIDSAGELGGYPMTSTIASYWLGGVAAAYQSWRSLLMRYMQGLRAYALNGDEVTLKTTVNTDQGAPYMSRLLVEASSRAVNPADRGGDLPRHVVPDWTRCVVAAVDVQGGSGARFEVQVHAIGPHMEQQLIDRYSIKESARPGMGSEFAPIDPAAYGEDWDLLTERVLRSTYRTNIEGREIRVRFLVVDSGGEDGVTDKAYAWYRRIRREGMQGRVMLYKGATEKKAPIIRETWVGKRHGREDGDVPLYLCNPHLLADGVFNGIKRDRPGPNFIHFPKPKGPKNPNGWLPMAFFDELQAEIRNENGTWTKIRKRNESFDLCKMIRAGLLRMGLDKIKDWNVVPTWLAPLAENSELMSSEDRREMKSNERVAAEPGDRPAPSRYARRRGASSYVA